MRASWMRRSDDVARCLSKAKRLGGLLITGANGITPDHPRIVGHCELANAGPFLHVPPGGQFASAIVLTACGGAAVSA
jgi:hypothetical protein